MQVLVEIIFRNMDRSAALVDDISGKVRKLENRFDRITRCQVVVEAPHRRHLHGNLYRIRIKLIVPHRELIVGRVSPNKKQHENPFVAVRDAFDAMSRQLKEYVRERHDRPKILADSPHGQIARICLPAGLDNPERGFGIISTCDGREVYFDASRLRDSDFLKLEVGSEVQFIEEQGDDGALAASVQLVEEQHHFVD